MRIEDLPDESGIDLTLQDIDITCIFLTGALAGIQKYPQAADRAQFLCWQEPRVPSGLPSQRFAISVRIRFRLSFAQRRICWGEIRSCSRQFPVSPVVSSRHCSEPMSSVAPRHYGLSSAQ